MEVLTVKKNIKPTSGKRSIFTKVNKRAYIALAVLLTLISVSVVIRNRAAESIEQVSTFDDKAWNEAIAESGVNLPEVKESEVIVPTAEKEAVPVSVAAPVIEETEPEVFDAGQEVALNEELVFIRPTAGQVLEEFSGDELVYSETMDDWRTHNGIDFAAAEGDQVVAAFKGVVKKVYNDDLLGITVEVEHNGGVVSRYSGLQSLGFIEEGKSVNTGDIIGGVGKNGALEQESQSHLHFEILKNGEYENPELYFSK